MGFAIGVVHNDDAIRRCVGWEDMQKSSGNGMQVYVIRFVYS